MVKVCHDTHKPTKKNQHWLLPDGVADVLFSDAQKQESLRDALLFVLTAHGYRLVSPPLIEYTESLLAFADEDLRLQTFRFVDQINGRMMGLRADITPQILRIDGRHGSGVSRYCYVGQVVKTLPQGLFGLRTPLQLGAEIFGIETIEAELSLIDLLADLIEEVGLGCDKLHIDVGHVAVFERLCRLHCISQSDADDLMSIYQKKAIPELKVFCENLANKLIAQGRDGNGANDFLVLAQHTLGNDQPCAKNLLDKLSAVAKNDPKIIEATQELVELIHHIQKTKFSVSLDLTELSGYHYHTGLIFHAYLTIGQSTQALVRGGRFLGISQNQQDRPATGFSMDINRLLEFIELEEDTVIWVDYGDLCQADESQLSDLKQQIKTLQAEGCVVIKPLNADDKPSRIDGVLHYDDQGDQAVWAVRLVGDDA